MVRVHLITHPDVVVDEAVAVPRWPLSPRGRARMRAGLGQPWLRNVGAVYSSTEQKAVDGATILAEALGVTRFEREDLGENDRSSTGFLPRDEFDAVANEFFAHPERSVRGWETALQAQSRIRRAVDDILATPPDTDVAIVSHGGVGTLLLCHLMDAPISRERDQPREEVGGYYYSFDAASRVLEHGWRRFDVLPGETRRAASRRRYAEELRLRSNLQSEALVHSFATVPREDFLGSGPWRVLGSRGYETTESDDPVLLYENVLVAIDEGRLLNNGEPSSLAAWFDQLGLVAGARVLHVGAGVGYYTAVLAETVGAEGSVIGVELDASLAEQARAHTAPWSSLRIESADGTAFDLGPRSLDAIFVNAGATHPVASWLDALDEGGRLLVPLTVSEHPTGLGLGQMLLVSRRVHSYAARFVSPVGIYPCIGARTDEGNEALRQAFANGGADEVRSLRRVPHDPDDLCWLHARHFCLRREPPADR